MTIAINDTWGNYIEIINYSKYKKKFMGTLRLTIYDHFGLNEPDMELKILNKKVYVMLAGFRAWFMLQHRKKYKGKYKPFATIIHIDVPFRGLL